MKIAIYTRKSKYSDKSESIDSQIEYCKQAAKLKYPEIEEYEIYVDEGFSGGNTDRPQFKKMIHDMKREKTYRAVISYKIDRISRSLTDFTNLQQELERLDVHIISASEGFDTSSTWGTAVLNILMIFAQIERANISERIRDTLLHYAKQGRWTGGLAPVGFESKSVPYTDSFGQEKSMVILSPVEEELERVKIIYKKYLELTSLRALEKYLATSGIKTAKGFLFGTPNLAYVLKNPVYCIADKNLYEYLLKEGIEVYNNKEEFNGSYSVLSYNKTTQKNSELKKKEKNEWVVALSKHQGVISSEDWIKAQHILKANHDKYPRIGTAMFGIFSGLIKCSECGSTMRIKKGRAYPEKNLYEFFYVCHLKEITKKEQCTMQNIIGHKAEPIILEKLKEYAKSPELQQELARKNEITILEGANEKQVTLDNLKKSIIEKETAIKNIVTQISKTEDHIAGKYLMDQIIPLDKELEELKHNFNILETELIDIKSKELDMLSLVQIFENMEDITNISDVKKQRRIMSSLIKEMKWDGKTMTMYFKTGSIVNFNELKKGGDFCLDNLQTFDNNTCVYYSN